MTVSIAIPLYLPSALNLREHHMARHRRVKAQRKAIAYALGPQRKPALPVTVVMVRVSPGELDDDNLCGAFKAVRDQIAKWLGVNDRDPRIDWQYAQERAKTYGIRIGISA